MSSMRSLRLTTTPTTPGKPPSLGGSTSESPSSNTWFSTSALKPQISRRTAVLRLQSNGVMLSLYLLVWALPRYYRTLKSIWTVALTWIVGIEWALWLNSAVEGTLLVTLLYNTAEAAYCLRYPQPLTTEQKLPRSHSAPHPITPAPPAAHRRLLGSPKSPLPPSVTSPTLGTTSPTSYRAPRTLSSSILGTSHRSPGSETLPHADGPFRSSAIPGSTGLGTSTSSLSFSHSQSFSSLNSSTSSTGSYLAEFGGMRSQSGRSLDTAVLQRLVTELEFE